MFTNQPTANAGYELPTQLSVHRDHVTINGNPETKQRKYTNTYLPTWTIPGFFQTLHSFLFP